MVLGRGYERNHSILFLVYPFVNMFLLSSQLMSNVSGVRSKVYRALCFECTLKPLKLDNRAALGDENFHHLKIQSLLSRAQKSKFSNTITFLDAVQLVEIQSESNTKLKIPIHRILTVYTQLDCVKTSGQKVLSIIPRTKGLQYLNF